MVFPYVFLSEHRLGRPCPPPGSGPTDKPGPSTCFDQSWGAPADGIIVTWTEDQLPNPAWYRAAPGRNTTIGGHPAKLHAAATTGCDGMSTATGISAVIKTTRDSTQYGFLRVVACIGPDAPASEEPSVYTMLASLTFLDAH